MDRAVKISKNTLDLIAAENGGVMPEVEKTETYFITSDDPHVHNLIVSKSTFRESFEFIGPELEDQFTEVREL